MVRSPKFVKGNIALVWLECYLDTILIRIKRNEPSQSWTFEAKALCHLTCVRTADHSRLSVLTEIVGNPVKSSISEHLFEIMRRVRTSDEPTTLLI